MMKVPLVLLLALAFVAAVSAAPLDVLNAELAPPPRRSQMQEHDQSLLAVASSTHMNAAAELNARVAAQTALATEDSVVAAASIEAVTTAAGQMSAEEQALVNRMIAIPQLPDPAQPVEYTAPPTRDTLLSNLGPRGYPWPLKLENALNTVQSATRSRINDLKRQTQWSAAASKLVQELGLKKNKVSAHVAKLTGEIKTLLGKKKQLQNKLLQDKLVERLEQTHSNLKKVRRQTHAIKKNEAKMIHHKEELAHALEGIKRSLALLKGMKRERQFPARGHGKALEERLEKFDPDLSFEKEADEVRQLQFPDAVLLEEAGVAHE